MKKYIKPYRNDIPHGMAKQTIMQLSMLQNLTDKQGHLTGGSSGSMCIDSKFNLVGINYLETSSNDNQYYGNTIALFNSQTPFENFEEV